VRAGFARTTGAMLLATAGGVEDTAGVAGVGPVSTGAVRTGGGGEGSADTTTSAVRGWCGARPTRRT
jgi:hypothetical protein